MDTILPFFYIIISCYLLKYACDTFEQAAGYLGRNFAPGIKGATVNAIGSSMPEMFVVIACLFWFNDPSLVMVALGVTAGSAIFNGCVIPALSILMAKDEGGKKVDHIELDKRTLLRDVFWVLAAEIALIVCLGFDHFTIWMAIILNLIYVGYGAHLYYDSKKYSEEDEEYDIELDEFTDEIDKWVIDVLKGIGCDTAKSVLELSRDELARRSDLEDETIDDIIKVIRSEFDD